MMNDENSTTPFGENQYEKLHDDDVEQLLQFLNTFKSTDEFVNAVTSIKSSTIKNNISKKILSVRNKIDKFNSIEDLKFLENIKSGILLDLILSISKISVNEGSINQLTTYLGIDNNIAKHIVSNRPYKNPEEILKIDEIEKNISLDDLRSLFRLYYEESISISMDDVLYMSENSDSQISYGVLKNEKITKVFIKHPSSEIISAQIDEKGDIDYTTIKLFTYSPRELIILDKKVLQNFIQILHSVIIHDAGHLWMKKISKIDPIYEKSIHMLSQHIFVLLQHTRPRMMQSSEDCIPNGCTAAPDLNFIECCDAHDLCYCKGGSETERYRCDKRFFDCVNNKAGVATAWVYYCAVRVFGEPYFDYKIYTSTPINATKGKCDEDAHRCHVTVKLASVEYLSSGSDIGEDVSYKVYINGARSYVQDESIFEHGDIKSINRIIFERDFGNCGDEILLHHSIFMKETEGLYGEGSNQYLLKFKCECENIYYDFKDVIIDQFLDLKDAAIFRFFFIIETSCKKSTNPIHIN